MNISELRQEYHRQICSQIIRITRSEKGDYPNFADGSSAQSVSYAWGILSRLSCKRNYNKLKGQTAGTRFERITKDFVEGSLTHLQHVRPGEFEYFVRKSITQFAQYDHLNYI